MPGQTQPWRSSIGDEGVGAALEGGGRKRRVRSTPVRVSDERGGSGHLDEGSPTGAKQATARQTAGAGERVAGLSRERTEAGGSRRSRNGAAVPSAMPRAARCVERTPRRLGARVVPRGSVTRQKLFVRSVARVREDDARRSGRTGNAGPNEAWEREGASGRGEAKKNRFTRLGGAGLGPRVRPEVALRCDRGPTPEDAASRCAPPGTPAGRQGHQRYAGWTAPGADNAPGRSVGSPKRAGSA